MPISTSSALPRAGLAKATAPAGLRAPAWSGIFVGLLLLFLVVGRGSLFRDPGVFWHTAFGQQVLSGDGIPLVDTSSFTRSGESWLDLQWLGECLMAAAYNFGGWDTSLMLGCIVLAATYTWLAQRFLARGMHAIAVLIILAIVLAASSHHFHVRPHLASIGLLGVTVAILVDIEAGRRGVAQLAWLVPLFAIWSNIHGGVLGGLASVCLVVVGWIVLALLGQRSPLDSLRKSAAAVVLTVLAALALLATPHGWAGVVTCVRIMQMPLPNVIQEHRPTSLLRVEGWAVALLAVAYFAALFNILRSSGIKSWRASWGLPLVWLVLAMMRVRHAPLFAIVSGVCLAEMIPFTRARLWLAENGLWNIDQAPQTSEEEISPRQLAPVRARQRSARAGWCVVAVPVLLALALQGAALRVPVLGSGWAKLEAAGWPMSLAGDLRTLQAKQDRPLRIFNQLHFGGFIIFNSPGSQVFIDDRCELYGFELLSNYAEAETSQPERIRDWHAENNFDAALVAAGSAFDQFLAAEPGWQLHAKDAAAVLYVPADDSVLPEPGAE